MPSTSSHAIDTDFVDRFLEGKVSGEESLLFAQQPPEFIAFTMLAIQKRLGQLQTASGANTPPSTIPPYEKPPAGTSKRGRNKNKRGGQLKDTGDTRERISEDIPGDLKPVITKDIIHRDWCPKCRKRVEPKPPDLLPHCQPGNRTLVLSALLHYLQGQTHWLWCFASDRTVHYMIDKSRGSPALQKFFTRYFDGTLITDFRAPYDAVACADRQKCWPHLLRDMSAVDEKHSGDMEWASFSRRVAGVFRDAKKLYAAREEMAESDYDEAVIRLEGRLHKVACDSREYADAKRLAKRMAKYGNEMLTFLWYDDVASDNNAAERAIRPAVVIRKNSYANQSEPAANRKFAANQSRQCIRSKPENSAISECNLVVKDCYAKRSPRSSSRFKNVDTKKAGCLPGYVADASSLCVFGWRLLFCYTPNELPQPQLRLAFGLWNWKPRCSIPS